MDSMDRMIRSLTAASEQRRLGTVKAKVDPRDDTLTLREQDGSTVTFRRYLTVLGESMLFP